MIKQGFYKYEPQDLLDLDIREEQKEVKPYQTRETANELAKHPYLYSYFEKGKILCVGGLLHKWEGRAESFFVYDKEATFRFLVKIRRFTREMCELSGYKRIEATIKKDDTMSFNWMKGLGFEREGLMRKFGTDGEDYYMYARIR